MRFVGLAIIILSLPLFHALMNGSIAQRRVGWFALGLFPFVIGAWHLEVSIISWAIWPGYVKGMLVSLLDTLALAIVLTTREPARGRPMLWAYLLYLAGSAVATAFATSREGAFFFSWQLARCILVFVAVSKVTSRPNGFKYIVAGLGAGVAYQAYFSILQRTHGVNQASGTMPHQNLLGLCTHFALFLSLAAILSGDRRKIVKIGVAGAMIAVVLTGSRATTGLAGGGVIALLLLSLIRRPTPVKMKAVGIGLAMFIMAAPVAYMTLHSRFKGDTGAGDYDERAAFERAARMMWSDHPMGVGANQYVIKANTDGYSQRAGVVWNAGSRSANVHNTYLLIGAETGYIGWATFLLLLGTALWRGAKLAWRKPRGASGEIALGATVALVVVSIHCLYEWVFVMEVAQYLFAILLGVIAGIAKQQQVETRDGRPRLARSAPPVAVPVRSPVHA